MKQESISTLQNSGKGIRNPFNRITIVLIVYSNHQLETVNTVSDSILSMIFPSTVVLMSDTKSLIFSHHLPDTFERHP